MYKYINDNRRVYFLSSLVSNSYIIISLPILTSYLNASDYGAYVLISQFAVIVHSIFIIFFTQGILKFWVDTPESEKRDFMGTLTSLVSILLIVFVIFSYLSGGVLLFNLYPSLLFIESETVIYTIMWMIALTFKTFFLSFTKVLEKPTYTLYQAASFLFLLTVCLIYLIHIQDVSLMNVIFSFALSELVSTLVLLSCLKSNITLSFKFKYISKFFRFTYPLITGSFVFIIFLNMDRIILANFTSLESIAIYGVGLVLANLGAIILTVNISAYSPRVKKEMFKKNFNNAYKLINHYFREISDIMLLVFIGISLLSTYIINIFAHNYSDSLSYLIAIILSLSHFFRFPCLVCEQILFNYNETKKILLFKILLALFGLILIPSFLFLMGLLGVALALPLAYLLTFIVSYQSIRKYNLLKINFSHYIQCILIILFIFSLEGYAYYTSTHIPTLVLEAIIFACYSYRTYHQTIINIKET